jgi:hypothetical protein
VKRKGGRKEKIQAKLLEFTIFNFLVGKMGKNKDQEGPLKLLNLRETT